jgi:TATA-binding protein-associated factor Taf7
MLKQTPIRSLHHPLEDIEEEEVVAEQEEEPEEEDLEEEERQQVWAVKDQAQNHLSNQEICKMEDTITIDNHKMEPSINPYMDTHYATMP